MDQSATEAASYCSQNVLERHTLKENINNRLVSTPLSSTSSIESREQSRTDVDLLTSLS